MTRVYVTLPSAGTQVTDENGDDQFLALVQTSIEKSAPRPGLVGVTEVEGEAVAPVFWHKATDEGNFKEGQVMAFSEPFGQIKLEPPSLRLGEWPQPGQHQVAIELRMADDEGLKRGR